MIRNNTIQTEKIEFRIQAPDAKSVGVAGTFNGWDPTRTLLHKHDGGRWSTALNLEPGRYEYRFVVDGRWLTDPNAKETAPTPYGERNSVLVV
ncbi:MAG TPA: isoamylase early set domain-containing protein [Verrucomicrobiae bacterium]|nr:isoamylase early set domain-containing protein [Verrucomicrobiae bacterium]